MVSVLIVEDDPIIAHDISIILEKHGYEVVDVCHKAEKAIDRLSKGGVDIAILDIHLGPGDTGIDIARVIHERLDLPYIFLTSFSDAQTLQAAQEQGPYGYLVKPFQEATLLTTISIALSNHKSITQGLDLDNMELSLTDQEKNICKELYKGGSYQEIADKLKVSINTIRYHIKNLYVKLDVSSRAELVNKLMS